MVDVENQCIYCGGEARYQFKNGMFCCKPSKNSCPSQKLKNGVGNLGKKLTEETKRKISSRLKGRKINEYTIIRLKEIHTGTTWSESRRQKMELYYKEHGGPMKEKNHTENAKRKISEKNKGYKHTTETKKKISSYFKGKPKTEIAKRRMSIAAKKRCKDPGSYFNSDEFRRILKEKMLDGQAVYMNTLVKNPSNPQVELFHMIQEICPYPILNYPSLFTNYVIDIAVPKLSLAIEYDEPYWHQDKKHDVKRQQKLENEGWMFLRYRSRVPTRYSLLKDILEIISS